MPFTALYILPFLFDAATLSWMQFSALSLVLIPLCFGYAIIRYRLMDVDIIFKRGLAYTAATAAVVARVFCDGCADRGMSFTPQATGSVGRHDRHRGGGIPVSAVSRMDSGAPGPFLLSRPLGLPPHADRIWTHADQRSAPGADAGLGDGSHLANACWWIGWRFSWRTRRIPEQMRLARSMGVRLSERAGSEFPEIGPTGICARIPLLRIGARTSG